MFQTKHLALYLDDISPALGKNAEGDERQEVELLFRIHPLTPELAAECDAAVRDVLFEQKGQIIQRIKAVTFDLTIMPQYIELRSAPDVKTPWLQIPIATISKIKASRHKDVAGWALTFWAKFETPNGTELARLHKGYTKQHFASFEQAAKDLIAEMEGPEKTAERSRGRGTKVEGSSDVTH